MRIAVLGASGATGHQLARQAYERGHSVTAIARDPDRIDLPNDQRITRIAADVHDHDSIARAIAGADVVVSGLGRRKGDQSSTLLAGARALTARPGARVIWLGAYGTGSSAQAAGLLTRSLLGLVLKAELADKTAADQAVLAANGTVFHAARLTDGPLVPHRRVPLADAPKRIVPRAISRATVAAAMLDEAETPTGAAQLLIPLSS
ncbi:NAD(P)-dependent oxidoreductase [uncultured Jatrophihabitans sp.]|uniref:NAD(P)-dependent oxidoreductase n=1 Tax=uncultured Jatrophihabitans sp. TaxID=1610747 RepID=UPI0035CAA4CE